MADKHWETISSDSKLEKANEVNVDLNAEPPELPPEFVEKYGDLLKALTKALAELACSGDEENLHNFFRFMIWLNGVVVREVAALKCEEANLN